MARPRVLLVYPSSFRSEGWGGAVLPTKTHMVALFTAVSQVAECDVLDLEVELGRPNEINEESAFALEVRHLLGERTFDILAVSCWTSLSYRATKCVLEAAAVVRPDAQTIVGGYHATARPDDFEGLADIVVTGEGESALVDVVKGTPKRGKGTRVVAGRPSPMESAPELDWEGYPYLVHGWPLGVYLSRGCPFSCSFCMEGVKGVHRALPVDEALRLVARTLEVVEPSQLRFSDACFGASPSWRRDFLRGLVDLGAGTEYWAETRADLIDGADAALMAKLDMRVDMGLDTASPEMLEIMAKCADPATYLDTYAAADAALDEHGVPHTTYLLFNHPGESRQTVAETLSFMERLVDGKDATAGWIAAQSYAFFPGSLVDRELTRFERRFGTRVLNPRWWTMEGPLVELASRVIPSRHLTLSGKNFWKAGMRRLQRKLEGIMSDEARSAVGVKV